LTQQPERAGLHDPVTTRKKRNQKTRKLAKINRQNTAIMSDTESDVDMDDQSIIALEPDSDLDEVESQYDSCYSSGRLVICLVFSLVGLQLIQRDSA
jgi:hypothetical protein